MARQERDFPHLSAFFSSFEREVSVTWAPKMHSPLFGVFEHDVSAKRAWHERDQIAFDREMIVKIALHY